MFLLRVLLPDVPGSLGRLASAIGGAGGDIDAIEIVERYPDGTAVDDVFVRIDHGVMPDSVVSACTSLDGVEVLWISRYGAGANLTRDLEAVEAMTDQPGRAKDVLVDLIPGVFVVDWAMRVGRSGAGAKQLHGSSTAPQMVPDLVVWPSDAESLARGHRFEEAQGEGDPDLLVAGCGLSNEEMVVMARHGGPEILDSEIARLRHLAALATSIDG